MPARMSAWGMPGQLTRMLRWLTPARCWASSMSITCAGEPYSVIQQELRRRFPDLTILFSPLAGEMGIAYLLPVDLYGKGLYQEEPSILAAGCLEQLTEAIAVRINEEEAAG